MKRGFWFVISIKSRLSEEDYNFRPPLYLSYPEGGTPDRESLSSLVLNLWKRWPDCVLCIFHQDRNRCAPFQNFIWEIQRAEERIRVWFFSKNTWLFITTVSQKNIPWVVLIQVWALSLKIISGVFIGISISKPCSRRRTLYMLSDTTCIFSDVSLFDVIRKQRKGEEVIQRWK